MTRLAIGGASLVLMAGATLAAAAPGADVLSLAAHNDVIYLAPARQGWEGLPVGNGTFTNCRIAGCLVHDIYCDPLGLLNWNEQ